MRKFPAEFLLRFVGNVARARFLPKHRVLPMVTSFYVTMKCNFRCGYCDDGTGAMYPDIPEIGRLDTQKALRVLEIVRRSSPGFNITGGEPTLRADLPELLQRVGELGFSPVTFNTNAFLLDRHLESLKHIDYLVVSLDALDDTRGDALVGLGRGGQTKRVLKNLNLADAHRTQAKLSYSTIINTVILPETIDDAWDVWELCRERGWLWSPMPHVIGAYPNPGLIDNPRWQQLVDAVIAAKKQGARIYGNFPSLEAIRDFTRYECFPTTRPLVFPDGQLMYPCGPLNKQAGNLIDTQDFDVAMQQGIEAHGPVPACDARCHLGCYMETSTSLTHPDEALVEAMRFLMPSRRAPRVEKPPRDAHPLPDFSAVRAQPALPPGTIRRLRKSGALKTSYLSPATRPLEGVKLPGMKLACSA
jgi:MoaA/NifB/PqqE/SkfB family radical SAM enzyme